MPMMSSQIWHRLTVDGRIACTECATIPRTDEELAAGLCRRHLVAALYPVDAYAGMLYRIPTQQEAN